MLTIRNELIFLLLSLEYQKIPLLKCKQLFFTDTN